MITFSMDALNVSLTTNAALVLESSDNSPPQLMIEKLEIWRPRMLEKYSPDLPVHKIVVTIC